MEGGEYPFVPASPPMTGHDQQPELSRLLALYERQCHEFAWLRDNREGLSKCLKRTVLVAGNEVQVQFNPHRSRSVNAAVDKKTIAGRPCFLCPGAIPAEQKALSLLEGRYAALCNPMPIFDEHFTITLTAHEPQELPGKVEDMFKLSRLLGPRLTVFFNGASAGASAPDHLHFQAAPAAAFPLLRQFGEGAARRGIEQFCGIKVHIDYADTLEEAASRFNALLDAYPQTASGLFNTLVVFGRNQWRFCFIPRARHRPACFFLPDDQKLAVSPAAVEMAGVVVTARQQDFERLDTGLLEAIFAEVALPCQQDV